MKSKNQAVIIPCFNEEITIGEVIGKIQTILPESKIYVFDNNSTDDTGKIAKASGASVILEKRQGKGFVIQSMFKKVEADIYIMVDGDSTYDVSNLQAMVSAIANDEADMVVGNRLKTYSDKSFRPFHTFGNKVVRFLINKLFKVSLQDIMSGFRVMSRDFVKNINITSAGFEVETEMTIKAIKYGYVIKEVDINYGERPPGSHSKLNTFKDGLLVLKTIFIIFRDYKPLIFFTSLAGFLLLVSLLSGSVVIFEFIETRYITHVPLAILASGAMILSLILFATGVMLDSIHRRFDELYNYMKNK
ncbi:MAG: glycosyltransferase [Desulfobacterales bacterium]|jgi:glycosyltransferase involved in cell wall biosynthesis|nr:glycosyltransferase [Desulfobacterales bacterium]